jgi:hypothetical protein
MPASPLLRIKLIGPRQAVITWPAEPPDLRLEECIDPRKLHPWVPVEMPVTGSEDSRSVTVPSTETRFYRLRGQ